MTRVLIIGFEGAQTLDVTGPAEVFAAAGRATAAQPYRVELASVGGGDRVTSSALVLRTRDLTRLRPRRDDTVMVAGGEEAAIRAALADERLVAWLRRANRVVRRMASVCSGAFILASAGILDGRRAATHWSVCDLLARTYPRVTVDANAIFVTDGHVWTSAGVTTGIDAALAMVEQDLGSSVADAVAARLVLYMRRPGFQSQFSETLVAQTTASDPLSPAISWARAHLAQATVDTLARQAALSVRTLHRRCLERLGTTPAKLLDKLRVEHARALLARQVVSTKVLAAQCGFGNATRMRRAFERELGLAPRAYRDLHSAELTAPPEHPPRTAWPTRGRTVSRRRPRHLSVRGRSR